VSKVLGRGQTGNTKLVKQMNRHVLISRLREYKRVSRADLAKLTELSRPCVSSLVDEMIREGLVKEVGIGESKGGRKPILLEYNFKAKGVIAAVFEGSTLHMSIADLSGELLFNYGTRLSQPTNGEMAIRALEVGVDALLKQSGFDKDRLLGIGIGLPGITQRNDGTISYAPSTGWMGLPVQQEMEERLSIPVFIENDVNLMTIGEFHQGIGFGVRNQVHMYVGTGIGAGIIIDGQFYRGFREAAGEIGYMMIGPVGRTRRGEYGVFERNYSVSGIIEKAKLILPGWNEDTSVITELMRQSEDGNREAEKLLEDIYIHWAYGMVNMISVLDPELLILNGEMVNIGEEGLKKLNRLLAEWVPFVPPVKVATLGVKAGIIGAIQIVLEALS
jgi:predicted NBD/HSP70 family sugar kinase